MSPPELRAKTNLPLALWHGADVYYGHGPAVPLCLHYDGIIDLTERPIWPESMGYVSGDRPQPESTRMGYSLSWIAVKGKPPQAVRDEFSFRMTDRREEIPESDLSAVEMPTGWYLIVSNHTEQVVANAAMRHLSSSGCELVTCFVEEHVMVSRATGWKDGQLIWSVTHDAEKCLLHLDVQGEPPAEFAAIRDRMFAEQAAGDGDCDYLFDIPVETARSVVGYRHDEDVSGLSGEVFEVLAPLDERPFLKKLFDGWFDTPRSPTHR